MMSDSTCFIPSDKCGQSVSDMFMLQVGFESVIQRTTVLSMLLISPGLTGPVLWDCCSTQMLYCTLSASLCNCV